MVYSRHDHFSFKKTQNNKINKLMIFTNHAIDKNRLTHPNKKSISGPQEEEKEKQDRKRETQEKAIKLDFYEIHNKRKSIISLIIYFFSC